MDYEYEPPSLKDEFENYKLLKKKYNVKIADGITKFIQAVVSAENAYDIKALPFMNLEHKHGNMANYYSASPFGKSTKWRIVIQMLDADDKVVRPSNNEITFLKSIKKIRIKELSEHYAKY